MLCDCPFTKMHRPEPCYGGDTGQGTLVGSCGMPHALSLTPRRRNPDIPAPRRPHRVQKTITLPQYPRGCHVITRRIYEALPELGSFEVGLANIFSEQRERRWGRGWRRRAIRLHAFNLRLRLESFRSN